MYRAIIGALAIALLPVVTGAQNYPDKPIRMIVATPAGSPTDVLARMVQAGLSSALGQQIVIDNRSGAGGIIGAQMVAKALPDGYTLFYSAPGPLTLLPHLQKQRMGFDPLKDFSPISLVVTGPFLLVSNPSLPAKTIKEVVAIAKSEPGKLSYASAGNGSTNHLAMEHFKSMAGVNIAHVPYKGTPQALTDVMSDRVNFTLNSIPAVLQHIKSGRLRLLGISSAKRSPQLPDVPTISEGGVPGYEWLTFSGLLAPANTPRAILVRLRDSLAAFALAPDMKSQFQVLGYEPIGSTPAEFAAFLRAEWEKNAKLVKLSGATVD